MRVSEDSRVNRELLRLTGAKMVHYSTLRSTVGMERAVSAEKDALVSESTLFPPSTQLFHSSPIRLAGVQGTGQADDERGVFTPCDFDKSCCSEWTKHRV